MSQYTAFLDAANCLTSISNELSAVCENLEALLQVRNLRAWNLDCLLPGEEPLMACVLPAAHNSRSREGNGHSWVWIV